MATTYYLTSSRRQEILSNAMIQGASETINFDLSPWEEDNGAVTEVVWTVNSGTVGVASVQLVDSVASAVLTPNDIGESRVNISFYDGSVDKAIVILKVNSLESGGAAGGTPNPPPLEDHLTDFANPHQVTATQLTLGNVDNTSDADKPVSTAQQTALDLKLADLVSDLTPQLGSDLDLNGKGESEQLTAGESLVDGDLCYMDTATGKMLKTDGNAEVSTKGFIAMCTETLSDTNVGKFITYGNYTTTGLTAGIQYISNTAGAITDTPSVTPGDFIRPIGTAKSTTNLFFDPSPFWFELT